MGGLNPFVIKFAGLKEGSHKFNFKIDTKFFEGFDYFDFKSAELETKLELEKQETILNLMFKTKGDILVPCDLSMENFKMPVLTNFSLTIKFGEIYCDESDEILILPHGSHQIDISQYIYEMVVLSVPLKKNPSWNKRWIVKFRYLRKIKVITAQRKRDTIGI